MNEKIVVLVVTHKEFDDTFLPSGYKVIKVGNMLSDSVVNQKGYLTDSTGENIANENPYYCELTAQYWAWKNLSDNTDIIGISHYRRYFFDYRKKTLNYWEDILSQQRISELLSKFKVIMSFPTVKYPGLCKLYKNKSIDKQDKHWIIHSDIIQKDYPEMMDTFNKKMYGRFTIWGNMFISSRDTFCKYNEWLFDVLKKYDMKIMERGRKRIPRVDGFLSEQLLLIWMHHNFKSKDIYCLEIRNTESDKFKDYEKGIKGFLIKFARTHYRLLCLARYVRVGALLLMRREKHE